MTDFQPSAGPAKTTKIYYGYIITGLAFLVMMFAQGPFNAFGVFFNPLREEFNWTHAMTSGAFSLSMIVRGVFGVLMGGLTDRFGPRLVLTFCGILLGAGFFLMSRMAALWQFYVYYTVLIGTGMSGIWVPLLSSIARWFEHRRVLMTSLVVSGVGLGGMLVPPLANWLIEATDWRIAYKVVAVVVAVVVIIAAQFFRKPAQTAPSPAKTTEVTPPATGGLTIKQAFRTKQLWLLLLIFFASGYFTFSLMVHLVPYAENMGVSAMNASTLLAIMNGVSLAGILALAGAFGDRLGSQNVFKICFGLVVIGMAVLLTAGELRVLYLAVIPFGIAIGGLGASESPLVARMFGVASHGVIFGIAGLGFTSGTAIGPFVTGYLFDITGSYLISFIICAVVAVLGLFLLTLLRPVEKQPG